MQVVQIVLDKQLLQAVDQAAKRTRKSRSALVREALREHLQRLEMRVKENRDRQGYSRKRHTPDGTLAWEAEAAGLTDAARNAPKDLSTNPRHFKGFGKGK
jgi:Arc/MetJ-type ribon-helix-helix transcriptional regulator